MNGRFFEFKRLTPKLAYFIGAYLGDGHYDKWGRQYMQWSIDPEFVLYVRECAQEFLGALPEIRKVKTPGAWSKHVTYNLSFGCKQFGEWLYAICDGKRKIPEIIPRERCEHTKKFIEGYLDSEGWVSKRKLEKVQLSHFTCGFEATDVEVVEGIATLLRLFEVKVTKWKGYALPSGKFSYQYRINIESFCNAGFEFKINRKNNRLQEYMSLKRASTETERSIPLKEVMIQSDLSRNVKLT